MTRPDTIQRQGTRVLLVDAADRVLLFRAHDLAQPDRPYWFTPGGGVGAGETQAEAAARELYEETGLAVEAATLGEAVWHDVVEFPFNGRWFRQEQDFFLCRVQSWDVAPVALTDDERRSIEGHRWWPVDALESTTEVFYPAELPGLLRRLLGVT